MNIDKIVNDLTKVNTEIQIDTYFNMCQEIPSHHFCSVVRDNKPDNWRDYFSKNENKNLFSKGKERLQTWIGLLQEPSVLYFDKTPEKTMILKRMEELKKEKIEHYYFVLAGLIIIFQVFGDGNHRTAKYFYNNITNGLSITKIQENKIDGLMEQYGYNEISINPYVIDQIIDELKQIANMVNGGRQKKIKSNRKRKTNRKSKRKKYR